MVSLCGRLPQFIKGKLVAKFYRRSRGWFGFLSQEAQAVFYFLYFSLQKMYVEFRIVRITEVIFVACLPIFELIRQLSAFLWAYHYK